MKIVIDLCDLSMEEVKAILFGLNLYKDRLTKGSREYNRISLLVSKITLRK
jgi:hypothetical protein